MKETLKKAAKNKQYEELDDIAKLPNQSKIPSITVKVIKISRTINTSSRPCQICNIKDITGNRASLNLYGDIIDKLELFNVKIIKNLRKCEITKADETTMRLHTTTFTKIENCTTEDSFNFQNVGNGEATLTGQVIGCGELVNYYSCKVHYKKVDDQFHCPKCETKVEEKDTLKDFRLDLYVQISNNEPAETEIDVKEVLIFKRVVKIIL